MKMTRYTLGLLGLVVLTAGSMSLSGQVRQRQRNQPTFNAMSGTYELESTRGGNAQRTADMATRNLPQPQRDRAYQSLLNRLQPPTTLAIERNGRTVTISSSSGPRTTFDADGRTQNERWQNGRMTRTRAEFVGNRLSVSTSGNRNTDFLVTFEPLNYGNGLLVTRRLDSDDLRGPVTIQSYYRRVANQPRWDVYAPESGYGPGREPRPFFVPDGMRLGAVLDTSLSTRTSRSGQRFSMTVLSPEEYLYSKVYGVVARVTPYGPGRNADMQVDFDAIESIDGETFDFDAILESVQTRGGVTLRVDASGGVPDRNRTDATIQQGAVGAALGAIIGAIAGGGKGAAIGAVVGGASGVILAQDRDQYLDLPPGTRVTIIVTPSRYRAP
ncbi:MAG: glycine zipper domain-containing protein [Acidobacteria bacterium]|nr:glycine zipper domain-containing protein [Acidobacteriota bacterium]